MFTFEFFNFGTFCSTHVNKNVQTELYTFSKREFSKLFDYDSLNILLYYERKKEVKCNFENIRLKINLSV